MTDDRTPIEDVAPERRCELCGTYGAREIGERWICESCCATCGSCCAEREET